MRKRGKPEWKYSELRQPAVSERLVSIKLYYVSFVCFALKGGYEFAADGKPKEI